MDKQTRRTRALLKKFIYALNDLAIQLLYAEKIVPERGCIISDEQKEEIVKLLESGCKELNIGYEKTKK